MVKQCFLYFLILTSVAITGWAAIPQNMALTTETEANKWAATIYGDTSISVNTPNDESRNLTSNLIGSLYYQLPYKVFGSFSTGFNKNYRGRRKLYLINSYASFSRNLYQYQNWAKLTGTMRIYLPTNKPAYQGRSFKSRLYMAPRLDMGLSRDMTLSFTSSYTHNFYRYRTSFLGGPYREINTRNSIKNTIGVSYSPALIEGVFFSATFSNTHRWSTRGARQPDVFGTSQEISYRVSPRSFFTFGHSIGATTFKDDGVTSNIEFFNPNKSYVYISWTQGVSR